MPRKPRPGDETETLDTRYLFFGDSLTDNGLLNEISSQFLTMPVPFTSGGYSQSFTNGTVYADTWMTLEGVADANYLNFAIGGAEAGGVQTVLGQVSGYADYGLIAPDADFVIDDPASPYDGAYIGDWNINLAGQVDRYLTYFEDDPNAFTTASILIGFNDIAGFNFDFWDFYFGNQAAEFARGIGQSIEDAARLLVADGVDRIVLNTLPHAGLFAAYDDLGWFEQDVARELLDSISGEIKARADRLSAEGVDVELVRIDIMSVEITRDLATFGFATTEPFLLGTASDPTWVETAPGEWEPVFTLNPDTNPDIRLDQRVFYDEIHPTETMHDALAIFSSKSVALDERFLSDGSNTFNGGNGADMVFGRDGNDRLTLRRGDDTAFGGRGGDTLLGEAGADLLSGGSGHDSLDGGSEDDLLVGGSGADTMSGGTGDDILIGATSGDVLDGGRGADSFFFIDPVLTAASDWLGATILGDARDTLYLVLGEALEAVVGATAEAADLSTLGLSVSGVSDIRVLDYAALDTLELGPLWDEAQLWNLV